MKNLVVIPTYNEAVSIGRVIEEVFENLDCHVLVVDDASTDGTVDIVKEWADRTGKVFLIQREGKLGLGTAYLTAFKWGLERDYELFFEMDGDHSHRGEFLPKFVDKISEGYDVVVGSRYTKGMVNVVNWDFKRLLLSKFANIYASKILGLPFSDITSGFRCYRREVLKELCLNKIRSNGYAFQIEMLYRAYRRGFKVAEIPIIFYEREGGSSKMSKEIVREAAIMVWKLRLGL